MSVVGQVSSILHATLEHHVAQLNLLPWSDLQFHKLVAALFEVDRGHDHQVDCLAQFNNVLLGHVFDLLSFELNLRGLLLRVCFRLLILSFQLLEVITDNLFLDFIPLCLFLLKLSIEHKEIRVIFALQIIVQCDIMSDFISFFNQVKVSNHAWKIPKFVFPHLKQLFDDVLNTLADLTFM